MRSLIVGLIALSTMLNPQVADAQLIRFGDINTQPTLMPMPITGYDMYSVDYMYPMYAMPMYSVNDARMSEIMMAEMFLANDTALRARADNRSANLAALIPIILQLFPDLLPDGISVNDSNRLDRIEDKLDKLLAEHGISDSTSAGSSNSALATLIEQIINLLQPGNSRAPRLSSAAASIPTAKRDRMIKELRTMLAGMKNENDDPTVAVERMSAAVSKAQAALKEAQAEIIRAEAIEKIEKIKRERDDRLSQLKKIEKVPSLSEEINRNKAILDGLNQDKPSTGTTTPKDGVIR
jgi:hypothetical protein